MCIGALKYYQMYLAIGIVKAYAKCLEDEC